MRKNLREEALARKYKIDQERVISAVDVVRFGKRSTVIQAMDTISDRLQKTGQPEPITLPTCRICRGEYAEGVSGCGCPIHPSPGREWHGYVEYHKGGGPVDLVKERVDAFEAKVSEPEQLLPCSICGNLPKLDKPFLSQMATKFQFGYRCHDLGCNYASIVKFFETKELAREAWNKEFGKQPEVELLPCRQCEELPVLKVNNGGFWHACGCRRAVVPESYRWTEATAREEWNKAFGRSDNPYDLKLCECGKVPRSVAIVLGSLWAWDVYCSDCNIASDREDAQTFSEAARSWNEDLRFTGAYENSATLRYDLPTDVVLGEAELPEEYRNPHDLKPCECGEIPKPVACKYGMTGWRWAVGCSNGMVSDARTTFSEVIRWWNQGGHKICKCGEGTAVFRKTMPKCYDLPTDMVLDNSGELPEEYQVVTTIR